MKFLSLAADAIDISGRRIGRLMVLGAVERRLQANGKKRLLWQCRCDCGSNIVAEGGHLRKGHTRSCGCLRNELSAQRTALRKTHGESHTVEYGIWASMKDRCQATSGRVSKDYGERGIIVCEKWKNSFDYFLADIGRRPSNLYSLDRYPDNDGNYEPGNVRWTTREQQMNNRRNNVIVTALGQTKPLAEFFPNGSKWPVYTRCRGRIRLGWNHETVVLMGLLGR